MSNARGAARKILPPRWNMRVSHPCDFIAKVFPKGIVTRTGFAQIRACADRTVSERSPIEERKTLGNLCRIASTPMFLRCDRAQPLRTRPPLASSIGHAHTNLSDFFLTLANDTQLLEFLHDSRAKSRGMASAPFAEGPDLSGRPEKIIRIHVMLLRHSHRQELTSTPIRVSLKYIPESLALKTGGSE